MTWLHLLLRVATKRISHNFSNFKLQIRNLKRRHQSNDGHMRRRYKRSMMHGLRVRCLIGQLCSLPVPFSCSLDHFTSTAKLTLNRVLLRSIKTATTRSAKTSNSFLLYQTLNTPKNYDGCFIMKLGSNRYLRSKRSSQRSKMLVGTTSMPLPSPPVENEVMYWNRSKAILWAKANRSSTPELDICRF